MWILGLKGLKAQTLNLRRTTSMQRTAGHKFGSTKINHNQMKIAHLLCRNKILHHNFPSHCTKCEHSIAGCSSN